MENYIIKQIKVKDDFKECVENSRKLIEFMKQEIRFITPILEFVSIDEQAVENVEDLYHGFNRSINGALAILDEITEAYVDAYVDEIWLLRDEALELYDKAKQLFYESQGR